MTDPHEPCPKCDAAYGRTSPLTPRQRAERCAKRLHDEYERIAPYYNYETRPETAVEWEYLPENHRELMIAVVDAVLTAEIEAAVAEATNEAQAELDRIDRVLAELGAFDQGMELTRAAFIAHLARRSQEDET